MELHTAIKNRRSIRKYEDKDIPDTVLKELLELARYAPSSMDGQPWHFIVIRNRDIKIKLAALKNKYCPIKKQEYKADFLIDAAAVIVVCVDREASYDREIENAVLATSILMLAAHEKGLGSVYMSAYKDDEPGVADEIRSLLGIPSGIDPVTIVPLGYPAEEPLPKKTKPLASLLSHESFKK